MVGLSAPDDAGVYRLPGGSLLVQTVDFFTPVVDDPYDWGRVAAANALSDVYAMGGQPITAMQLVSWPRDDLPLATLTEVQRGGVEILNLAGCSLIGGHSIDDPEPKYGMAITGLVDEEKMMITGGARVGDAIVLTKPIGTGIISTAIKRGVADEGQVAIAVESMAGLNREAAELATSSGVRGATDVTGFGLLGHLSEMTNAAGVGATISPEAVPVLPGVRQLAEAGVLAGGSRRNRRAAEAAMDLTGTDDVTLSVLTDAQTSGGLLLAVPLEVLDELMDGLSMAGAEEAAVIGAFDAGDSIRLSPAPS